MQIMQQSFRVMRDVILLAAIYPRDADVILLAAIYPRDADVILLAAIYPLVAGCYSACSNISASRGILFCK